MSNTDINEKELEIGSLTILELAQGVTVTDQKSYSDAGEFLKKIKDEIKKRNDFFNPMKTAAHAVWKAVCNRQNESIDPLSDADKIVRSTIGKYLDEQERIRREEQRKAEEKARQEAEAKRKRLAKRAEAAKKNETKERLQEQAEEVEAEPVFVEPVIEKTTQLQNGSVTRKKDIEIVITDHKAFLASVVDGTIPLTCVEIKTGKVKAWVKAADIKKIDGAVIKEVSSVSVR